MASQVKEMPGRSASKLQLIIHIATLKQFYAWEIIISVTTTEHCNSLDGQSKTLICPRLCKPSAKILFLGSIILLLNGIGVFLL
jgi:hypothetical protein